MGTELRKTLERDNTAMQDEVKRLMKGFASERDAMAKAQKDTLLKGVVELRTRLARCWMDLLRHGEKWQGL